MSTLPHLAFSQVILDWFMFPIKDNSIVQILAFLEHQYDPGAGICFHLSHLLTMSAHFVPLWTGEYHEGFFLFAAGISAEVE